MHQVWALRCWTISVLIAAVLLGIVAASPVALADEPSPTPAVAVVREENLAGPLIGLSLVVASSALAVGIALGLRRRIDEIGDEGDGGGRE